MPAPVVIQDLVNRFRDSRELYRSGHYNEAQLRLEFLNPFFEALGWDMNNRSNFAPQYREVIHEDSLEVEGSSKAPDYAFRIGTTRKFFVEAKKPKVNIRYEIDPAYQLRRYAWNAHLPLSILTDFEELAIYDCRNRPDPKDSAATGRVKLFTYEEYLTRWDELAAIFSRDAVWSGSFDRFAEGTKGKQGTTEVDAEFLKEIEEWRLLLARNIALRNFRSASHPGEESLNLPRSERQLNYAVQTTIDRILFLRICEDRGIEPADQLLQIAGGTDVYARLLLLFQKADLKYNSGLFHFNKEKGQTSEPDAFTPALAIDDKVLRQIIKSTYYPCPYIFNEIPVEILGQVYEQFLGKVIRLTPGGQAKVEEKPEVRKAGGVYYTPSYIVDYIVQNTLGRLLGVVAANTSESEARASQENPQASEFSQTNPTSLTPGQALNLRVVDPACGSGSFLLGAYQYLLDWHLNYYLQHDPESHTRGKNPPLVAADGGEYRLTTETKKQILTASIYGVDIDTQAVEVTKLSLLLKLLEGETGQLSLGFERVLPDLGNNIRCGNSLIGWDYFQGQMFPDEEEIHRVNPFDWQSAFPQVFASGGFDAVIGNPPYIRIQSLKETDSNQLSHFKAVYKSAKQGNYDIYVLFIELALKLLNQSGLSGYIVPSKFFTTDYGEAIRNVIIQTNSLIKVVDFGSKQIFDQASTYTCLLFLSRTPNDHLEYSTPVEPQDLITASTKLIPLPEVKQTWVFYEEIEKDILKKLFRNCTKLSLLPAKIGRGSSSGNDKVFILKRKDNIFITSDGQEIKLEDEILRVPIFATNIRRYQFAPDNDNVIIFPYQVDQNGYSLYSEQLLKTRYPLTHDYLLSQKKKLQQRKQTGAWYGFSAPRNLNVHDQAVFYVPLLANKGTFTLVGNLPHKYCLMAGGGFSITVDKVESNPYYILGLLNSKLIFWFLSKISNIFRGGWITCTKQYVEQLPIFNIHPFQQEEIRISNKIVELVTILIDLQKKTAVTPREQQQLNNIIRRTDSAIDQMVYELYGLTEEEIKIVEANN